MSAVCACGKAKQGRCIDTPECIYGRKERAEQFAKEFVRDYGEALKQLGDE